MSVTRLEVTARRPYANGVAFGDSGSYEEVRGILHLAVDPDNDANRRITDIDLAPRGWDGRVEFATDFVLLHPSDPSKGRGSLLFDVLNRGRKRALMMFNDGFNLSTATSKKDLEDELDPGNGWLMRHGHTVVWCGWQPDAPSQAGRMRLYAPEALDNGMPLRGKIFSQFQSPRHVSHFRLADREHTPHPAADTLEEDACLTVRDQPDLPASVIPRGKWRFGRCEDGVLIEDPNFIALEGRFEPGRMYQLTYTTIGAPLVGLGYAAMRDTVSWLKYGTEADGNPCAGALDRALAFGVSQSGRFLRQYLYLDLNRDEQSREVLDGVMPHVAGGMRGEFNQRFGQPSKDLPSVIAQFLPSTALPSTDPVTETSGGLLERIDVRRSPVKVFFTNTGAEYWRGDASLIHTDPSGTQEIPEHPSTRSYCFASAMHGPGSWPPTDTLATEGLRGQHMMNTVDYRPLLRALLAALDEWVSEDKEPPESSHPRLSDGSAVPPHSLKSAFSGIPGLSFPPHIPIPRRLDFGIAADVEQTTKLPPEDGEQLGSLVSDVDEDGNETGGIRHPDVREPLGTHMPWNLRHPEIGVPEQLTGLTGGLRGSTVPFPATRAERERREDARRSIEERYASRDEYLSRVRDAANAMVHEGTMLQEDVARVVSAAAERWDTFSGS